MVIGGGLQVVEEAVLEAGRLVRQLWRRHSGALGRRWMGQQGSNNSSLCRPS